MINYKVVGIRKESGKWCNVISGLVHIDFAKECALMAIRSGEFYEIKIERE